jgi:hypothetical protein
MGVLDPVDHLGEFGLHLSQRHRVRHDLYSSHSPVPDVEVGTKTGFSPKHRQRCQALRLSSSLSAMDALVRVTDVEHIGGRQLRVVFSDGLVREIDFAGSLPGILSTIDNDEAFRDVSVDGIAGTVCWSNGIDLDPDVLHGDQESASGHAPTVLREYRLQHTA